MIISRYALALRKSLLNFRKQVDFFILVSEGDDQLQIKIEDTYPETSVVLIDQLCSFGIGKRIFEKYFHLDMSSFRWSMKPVLIKYLLEEKGYEKVFLIDADIYFFSDFRFLVDKLDRHDVLLSPDWRSSDPHTDIINFEKLYKEGIYNGGFIGANKNSLKAMDWWAMVCEFACVNDPLKGMYYDQVHLNMMPSYFENVGIIKHRGCNVANWNMVECKRSVGKDQKTVLIANEYPWCSCISQRVRSRVLSMERTLYYLLILSNIIWC